jgi:hypothetical protein
MKYRRLPSHSLKVHPNVQLPGAEISSTVVVAGCHPLVLYLQLFFSLNYIALKSKYW